MGRVVHFEIHCDDLDRAERFYTDVFGWTIERWDGPVDYRLVTTGRGSPGIDGALTARSTPVTGAGVIAYVNTIQVDDLAATAEAVDRSGGRQVTERQGIPGVGDFAYFNDTEGNLFGAMQPE